jgi:protein-arginine kinase activator protein McsA
MTINVCDCCKKGHSEPLAERLIEPTRVIVEVCSDCAKRNKEALKKLEATYNKKYDEVIKWLREELLKLDLHRIITPEEARR